MKVVKKVVMNIGDSLGVIFGKELKEELKLSAGDKVKICVTKLTPRQYFCYVDEYEFTSDDEINEVICPICGRNDTVKLLVPANRDERRSIKG